LSSFAPLDVNLLDRRSDQLVAQIDILREAVARVRQRTLPSMPGSSFPIICIAYGPRRGRCRLKPVKRGLVEHPADWPFSSFIAAWTAACIRRWRGGSDEPQQTGERL
jgi:hypothetical protein